MNLLKRLNSFDDNVDFRRGWRVSVVLSIVVVLIGLFSLLTSGLNLGIDFKGGTAWVFPANNTSTEDIQEALGDIGATGSTVQRLELDGEVTIRVEVGTDVDVEDAAEAMATASSQSVDIVNQNRDEVGPSWGSEVSGKALRALIVFFIVIALYISWRLEWRMAASALVAVTHDIVVSVGLYALFQFPVTPGTVVAFLTIMGYSLYDSIVVYDKVKENEPKVTQHGDYTYSDMMNLSLNYAFIRSLNTTISTVLPVLSILVIGSLIMGAVTLQEFGLALLIGLISGAYSSLFIAPPIVVWLKNREPRHRVINERILAERTAGATSSLQDAKQVFDDPAKAPVDGTSEPVEAAVSTKLEPSEKPLASPYSPKHPPRPRKKGKRR